jgi:phosphoesterase RecJ-like protein
MLKIMKKNSVVISPNKAPDFLDWTAGYDNIIYYDSNEIECKESLLSSDLIFTLDFNDLNRIGELSEFVKKSNSKIVMIDHHQSPKEYADIVFSEPETGSTCELLYEIFLSLGFENKLDKDISSCLYLGMMTDTGSFQYSSVTSRTHEIISNLFNKKIDHNLIYNKVYNDSSSSRLKVLGSALNSLNHIKELNTAYMLIKRKDLEKFSYKKGDSEGIVNYGLSLKGVIFCAIFIEDINNDNNVKISFRSIGTFPCNEYAGKHFSGGGHVNASGGRYEGNAENAIDNFLKTLPKYKDKLI